VRNPATKDLVGRYRAPDQRIEYLHTAGRGNDFGVTPWLEIVQAREWNKPA
jgi:hypothetical protein